MAQENLLGETPAAYGGALPFLRDCLARMNYKRRLMTGMKNVTVTSRFRFYTRVLLNSSHCRRSTIKRYWYSFKQILTKCHGRFRRLQILPAIHHLQIFAIYFILEGGTEVEGTISISRGGQ